MDANKAASVTFEQTRTLTTSAGANGSIDPAAGTHSYLDGASVTVTATPDEGYTVASWGGDCSTAGTATTCMLTLDEDRTASVTFGLLIQTLPVTVTGPGGEVEPSGTTEQDVNAEVTLTASWDDATHSFTGWSGDCVATTSTCVVTMDADKTVTATFTELPTTRCATTTAADCIRAVYLGAPGDYAQVADIPADKLLTPATDGRYHVERGQQYTVVTAAQLPEGWTRFYLQRDPGPTFRTPSPVSFSPLVPPVGTTFTFTVSRETGAPTHYLSGHPEGYTFEGPAQFSYDLKAAKPFVRPRPDRKPLIGDVVLTVVFQTAQFAYDSFDDTAMAATSGSYGFLVPDADAETEGATEPVTTYEQMRTEASVLVVNVMNGGAQEGFYDGIEDGELLEWREAEDCWTRFMVTGAPSGTGDVRTVPVTPYAYSGYGCSGAVSSDTAVTFDWDPGVIPTVAIGAPVHYGFGRWVLVPYTSNWEGRVPLLYEDVDIPPDPPRTAPHPLYSALTAHALRDWCRMAGTGTSYIEPGAPWENAYVESFNGRLRDELLAVEQFGEQLVACAQQRAVTAVYVLAGGEWVSYILGAPGFANQSFLDLFADGLPAVTPLVAKGPVPAADASQTGAASR